LEPFYKYIDDYKQQMQKGAVSTAYKGLMEYIMSLRTYLSNKYPDYYVPSSIYYGYMDMTYFSFSPKSLVQRKLKIGIVFIHASCRFEAWLAGYNKQTQSKYWQLFKESGWNDYPLVPSTQGVDAIIEYSLVDHPDFSDLDGLTKQIEDATLAFIENIDRFLTAHQV
jgi:hypothetical protein